MIRLSYRRRFLRTVCALGIAAFAFAAAAQETSAPAPSTRDVRAADDAYLAGARQLSHNDAAAAEKSFTRALALDPRKPEYALSLAVAREHRLTALVQQAAKARLLGHTEESTRLFAEARALDPDNRIIAQHLDAPVLPPVVEPVRKPIGYDDITRLGGPIHLAPTAGTHTFHSRGDAQSLLRDVYTAFGIRPTFDPSVSGPGLKFDLENVDYATATGILLNITNVFAVPLTSNSVLLAKDTTENRDRLLPQIEETVYLNGLSIDQLNELSNVAKNIFDLKQVTVQPGNGLLLLRGSEDALKLVNATFSDLLDGGAEVILDIHLYEVDKTHMRNIGAQLPSSAGVFSIAAEAQQLVSANQSLIDQAIAAGLLKLTGTPLQQLLQKLAFLAAAGSINVSQYTNLLGTFGNGLSFAGLYLGSSTSFNFLMTSSDSRAVDDVQLRVSDRQTGIFRSGTRYPITTSTYSSSIPSSLTSALQGVKINGQNASDLLARYGGAASSTVPQVSFEDLGLTLKATPQVLKSGQITVHLDMKIEALAGGQVNNIPVLNSRQLTSDITIAEGQTALLASLVSNAEQRAIIGLPGLSEIPGFQGTDKNANKDTTELLITMTPHLVRRRSPTTTTRRLLANISPAQQ